MKTQEINVIDNSTIISTTILGINYIARTVTVRVGMKMQESCGFLFKTVEAKLSNNLYQWLTYGRTKTGTNGEILTNVTGCDMFCSKNHIKDIVGHTFTCRNDWTQYERNPFRVHININGVVILYSVTHPTSEKLEYTNPVTGEIRETYRAPKDVNGNYVNLYPGSYRRLQVFKYAKVVA